MYTTYLFCVCSNSTESAEVTVLRVDLYYIEPALLRSKFFAVLDVK